MKIVETVKDLSAALLPFRTKGFSIGFVPTMGALHKGHLSLVDRCVKGNDICVVSIFVNPTQFNDKADLDAYPRTLQADCALLESAGCHYVFAPSVEEMYPEEDSRTFDLGYVAEVMEGTFRPGHFNGVAQIVSKLFDAVKPGRAYFGEKDFQQIAVIKAMTAQLKQSVQIVACPTVRENDGLAMSSRNTRLTEEERSTAPLIAEALRSSVFLHTSMTVAETADYVLDTLRQKDILQVEYFQIVDGQTLRPVTEWTSSPYIIGCIAVRCGNVRLIDNITYRKDK
jgi:pantoate--beta-alanine ligase